MPCEIASDSVEPQVLAWPSVSPEMPSGSPLFAQVPASATMSAPLGNDASDLKNRLAELSRSHQAEIAKAREAGFQDGFRQAQGQAAGEIKAASDRLSRLVGELALLKRKIRNEAEVELVNLSLAIARRILHRQISIDPEAIQGLVHAALEKLQNREISQVRVAPASADVVRDSLELAGVAPAVRVSPDTSLRLGDLIFETSLGDLDASVETQLEEIQRGFADRLALR